MEIPQVQSYFSEGSSKARRNSSVSVQKALNALGFGTWNELQTGVNFFLEIFVIV